MNVRQFVLIAASIATCGTLSAQEPAIILAEPAAPQAERVSIFETTAPVGATESETRVSKMSVAELRQQRALYKANQRMARIEYNLWMGYEPLRPKFNSIPMMSTRYSTQRLYVPVYVHGR